MAKYYKIAAQNGMIPMPLYGKKPNIKGWPSLTMDKGISLCVNSKSSSMGVITGERSGIFVVDVDVAYRGLDIWNDWIAEYGDIDDTFVVKTGGGGYHYYFKYDDNTKRIKNANRIYGIGIDIRSDGGQVVFMGSRHRETGNIYEAIYGYDETTGKITISTMPDWLFKILIRS